MSPPGDIRLAVIVPVYGNWGDTVECLRAFSDQSSAEFRVIVADDGSPEPPPEQIFQLPGVSYLAGPNLGFAGNCNRAADLAITDGATHLLFLNNDTAIAREFIAGWHRAVAACPEAILSPIVYWASDPGRVWFSGGPLSLLTPFTRSARRYGNVARVDIICGCAFLVPAFAWQRLGGFDRRYQMYFEDFDLALRARSLGIPLYVVPDTDVSVWHKVSGSFRGSDAWAREYRMIRARLRFIRAHYGALHRFACYGLAAAHFGYFLLTNLPEIPAPGPLWHAVREGLAQADERG